MVRISRLPLCCASFSTAPVLLLVVPALPWLPPHPVLRACGTTPRCSALANETHLDVPTRSSPATKSITGGEEVGGNGRTSMTSSNTTNAVPFVFGSFPMRICLMLP